MEFMNDEYCIVVDLNDKPQRSETKIKCHQENILHRAFSVFIFNTKNELLLQKRSENKITFPNVWTNTCCSHPLYNQQELQEKNQEGVKRAAIRKLEHELGIHNEVKWEEILFITRIYYEAKFDDKWGEHEIDYILLIHKDVNVQINYNEVSEIKYVNEDELKKIIEEGNVSPWFKLISEKFLFDLWEKLKEKDYDFNKGNDFSKIIHLK
eukprot:Anaeramoba_ignava/a358601_20.p1 GENE.a358601_20~~a358601_20.p1  ORF type:complete len:217 (+),score=67.98 a358601_20:22-651(+)